MAVSAWKERTLKRNVTRRELRFVNMRIIDASMAAEETRDIVSRKESANGANETKIAG